MKEIDAPEKGQAFGQVARQNLAGIVINRDVRVEWSKVDEWSRIIGKVLLDERDVCLEQIRAGLAWHFKKYQNEKSEEDRQLYDSAEQEARSSRRGLWHDGSPTEPWIERDRQPHNLSKEPSQQDNQNSAASPFMTAPGPESIIGNRRSMIYHWLGCPNYDDIAPRNRIYFKTREAAERAGYRAAKNC
jgi:hypothetical protein